MKNKLTKSLKRCSKQLIVLIICLSTAGSFAGNDDTDKTIHSNYSQQQITGIVKDNSGQLLPGANVLVKGTSNGTQTDFDGKYSINATAGEVLVFSFLGYQTQEITITNQRTIDVTLQDEANTLDEVVVVGYGTQKKVNLTGSVQTVTFKDEVNQPVSNSAQLLYGRFSGVQLTQTSGNPGADDSSVVIRGRGTFGSATPLVVIDNIQYGGLTNFNNLSPNDIESVTVLKDASASAIYGARGANGVIVVTTKNGKKGKTQVTYNSLMGVQSVTIKPEFLDSYNYALLMNEKFQNAEGANFDPRYTPDQLEMIRTGSNPDLFANTDWASEVLQSAMMINHNFAFSGGKDKFDYRLSLGYQDQNSVVRSKFRTKRYNMSFNLNSQMTNWLKLNTVTNAYWKRNEGPTGGQNAFSGDNGIIYSFQRTAPTIPVYYSNGEYGHADGAFDNSNGSFQTQNPIRKGFNGNFVSDFVNINSRLGLTFKLSQDLSFETSGSITLGFLNSSDFRPTFELKDFNGDILNSNQQNSLSNYASFNYTLLNENILRYKKTINDTHNVGVLVGHSVRYARNDDFGGSLAGFPTDNLEEFSSGGVIDPAVYGGASEISSQSIFGRLSYGYKGKYLAEFNLRRDGSSKFGPSNRYGTFPSASAGWRISEEDFMSDIDFISNLKIRGSWGISGNDRINNFIFSQNYNPNLDYVVGDDNTVVGVAQTSLANPDIRWEKTTQLDIGLDMSLFNNKIEFIADYFKRESDDILYNRFPIPSTLGISALGARNAASMVNEGLELGINFRENFGDLRVTFGANMTKFLNNEVTGLGDGGEETVTGTNIIRVGAPFRSYFGYVAEGIFQTQEEVDNAPKQFNNNLTGPGDIRYADISGPEGIPDGIVNADDRTIIGDPNPNILLNFNGSLEYNGFDFNFLFQGVSGVDRLLMGNGNLPMVDDRSNVLSFWTNRWTSENPSTSLPRLGGQNNNVVSSFYMKDASYLRLKNVELGYSLPKKVIEKVNIDKLRLFVGGQNLATFTSLDFFDPEGGSGNQSNRSVPLYKTITFGLNIKF